MKILFVLSLALLLTACGKTTAVIKDCLFAEVIYISQSDVLTEGTAVQIEIHNTNVETECK